MLYQFSVPCLMGVEGLVADELRYNGFAQVQAENGRVLFAGDAADCARANVILRCGERVLLRLGAFHASTFDQLFEGVRAIPWEDHLAVSDAFPVKGYSIGSQLHSVPGCQKIIKKAIVQRMEGHYGVSWFQEDGAKKQVQFSLMNDWVEIYLDTTGAPLYKRGYKLEQNEATLRETLAASMVKIARYRGREPFIDPFCGSGTIAIEAAMAALRIAPGARRNFDAQHWDDTFARAFDQARQQAVDEEKHEKLPIIASDIAPSAVHLTKENARRAGVGDCIEVRVADALALDYESGVLMCNPPYGVRLMDQDSARALCAALGSRTRNVAGLKKYIISSDEGFEVAYGQQADKKRKLYNGMIKCNLYMYFKG